MGGVTFGQILFQFHKFVIQQHVNWYQFGLDDDINHDFDEWRATFSIVASIWKFMIKLSRRFPKLTCIAIVKARIFAKAINTTCILGKERIIIQLVLLVQVEKFHVRYVAVKTLATVFTHHESWIHDHVSLILVGQVHANSTGGEDLLGGTHQNVIRGWRGAILQRSSFLCVALFVIRIAVVTLET